MKTILVADDDRDQADLLAMYLEARYNVIVVYSFSAAKNMLEQNKLIDILITDYDLHDGLGINLHTSGKGAPKYHVLITGRSFIASTGFDLCITKPIITSDFFPRLATLIA
jgi:DNA-binding NtrC family response regulator